jgi:hypothetical protein
MRALAMWCARAIVHQRIDGGMTHGVLSMDSFGFGLAAETNPQAA